MVHKNYKNTHKNTKAEKHAITLITNGRYFFNCQNDAKFLSPYLQ
jgi:hypothetical protein